MWIGFFFFAAVFALVVTVPQYVIGRGGTELDFPPAELIGTWYTDEPRYVGRTITITREELRLDLGADGQEVHMIVSIRSESGDIYREYEITYAGSGGDQVLGVFVFNNGLLRLRNPSEVSWRRDRD